MATLDELIGRLDMTDAEKESRKWLSLLAMSAGLLGARRGRSGEALAHAIQGGLTTGMNYEDRLRNEKMNKLKARGVAIDALKAEDNYNTDVALRSAIRNNLLPASPAETWGPPTEGGEYSVKAAQPADLNWTGAQAALMASGYPANIERAMNMQPKIDDLAFQAAWRERAAARARGGGGPVPQASPVVPAITAMQGGEQGTPMLTQGEGLPPVGATITPGPPAAPPQGFSQFAIGPPNPMRVAAERQIALASEMMNDPRFNARAMKMYEEALKMFPVVDSTHESVDANGNPILTILYKTGQAEAYPYAIGRKMVKMDLNDIEQWVDANRVKPGTAYAKGTTPGERLSFSASMANARARQSAADNARWSLHPGTDPKTGAQRWYSYDANTGQMFPVGENPMREPPPPYAGGWPAGLPAPRTGPAVPLNGGGFLGQEAPGASATPPGSQVPQTFLGTDANGVPAYGNFQGSQSEVARLTEAARAELARGGIVPPAGAPQGVPAAPQGAPAPVNPAVPTSGGLLPRGAPMPRGESPLPPLTEGTRKELKDIDGVIGTTQYALQQVMMNDKAFGFWRGAVPLLGGRMAESMLGRADTPGERAARSSVFNIVSSIMKERSGTAVSEREQQMLTAFLPGQMDTAQMVLDKLIGYGRYMEVKKRSLLQGPQVMDEFLNSMGYHDRAKGVSYETFGPAAAPTPPPPPGGGMVDQIPR